MLNFKTFTTYFSVLLLSFGFSSLVFANDERSVIQPEIIEDDENATLLSSTELLITPMLSEPSQLRSDWGALTSRSTFSNQSGSTRIYHNSGNYNNAMTEFTNLGGRGEVVQYVSKNGTTFVKTTAGGSVTLYRSTSSTLGDQRPTLSFLDDKIRFLGN
jgi:hypothetical protein